MQLAALQMNGIKKENFQTFGKPGMRAQLLDVKKGKLEMMTEVGEWYSASIQQHQITEIPVTSSLAILSTQISLPHKDPSDRIIAATAKEHNLTLLTPDPLLTACREIRCEW